MLATSSRPLSRRLRCALSFLFFVTLLAAALTPTYAAGPATATPVPLTPVPLQPGQKLKVLATTTIVGDVVKQVGGDAVDLTVLLPLGTDPHTFNPTPRDMAAVSDAQVIFANGAGLEVFLTNMLKNAGTSTPVVAVSDGITLRHLATDQPGPTPPPGQQENNGNDPHTWFSPINVQVWVQNIDQALSSLDPAHAADYKARAADYDQKLTQLDAWIKQQVAQIPPANRKLVTDHLAFGYYADRYGFEQIGAVIPSFSTAAQPSAQDMAQLEDAIRSQGVKAVIISNTINDALAQRVASDTGVKLVTLFDGSLGPAGSGAETYLDFMRYDTNVIVNALK